MNRVKGILCSLGVLAMTSCSTQGIEAESKTVVASKEQCLYAALTAFPKGDAEYLNVYESSTTCNSIPEIDKTEIKALIAMAGLRAIELWQEVKQNG